MKFSDIEDMSLEDLVNNGVITLSVGAGPNFPTDLYSYGQCTCWSIQAMQSIDSINSFSDNASSLVLDINNNAITSNKEFKQRKIEMANSRPKSASGSVYLILNSRNGYTKIGFTTGDPKYRESTLQSEEPEISMICSFPGTKIQDEYDLHELHKNNRIRGEWFDLSKLEVENIINAQIEVIYHD